MNNTASYRWIFWLICISFAFHGTVSGQQTKEVRLRDCWSRFPAGAWSRVRVTKQVFNAQNQLSPIRARETLSTLTQVDEDGYELRLDVDVKVGDRVFDTPSQSLKRGRVRQTQGETYRIAIQGSANLIIDGKTIPTTVYQIVYGEGESQRVSKIHYSSVICPFVLRQESHRGGDVDGSPETTVEVIALDMPYFVLNESKTVAYVKTTKKQDERLTVTYEVHCADIPGGLVSHSSITRNTDGKLLERSSLTLLEYNAGGENINAKQSRIIPSRRTRFVCQPGRRFQWYDRAVTFAVDASRHEANANATN